MTGFLVTFGSALVLLCVVMYTGLRALRKIHIPAVVLLLVALYWTVHYAYGLGRIYDLASAGVITPIHLTLAKATTVFFLFPIATGVRTLFIPKTRPLHRKLAFAAFYLTVVTAITGFMMLFGSERIAV